jgi:chromosome segregation ATPase
MAEGSSQRIEVGVTDTVVVLPLPISENTRKPERLKIVEEPLSALPKHQSQRVVEQLEFQWLTADTDPREDIKVVDEGTDETAMHLPQSADAPDLDYSQLTSQEIIPGDHGALNLDLNYLAEEISSAGLLELPISTDAFSNGATIDLQPADPPLDQRQRILQLEQALDQCQSYINELKLQLVEQHFLEEVLAKTEEAAHIQQQAINSLKLQLQQQGGNEAQLQELETAKLTIQAELTTAESLNQSYRLEILHLQNHLQQEQEAHRQTQNRFNHELADVQLQLEHKKSEVLRLDTQLSQTEELTQQRTEQLTSLKSRTQQLEADLRTHQQSLHSAEANLQRTKEIVIAQQDVLDTLQQGDGSDSSKNTVIQKMSKSLLQSQNRIEVLETEIVAQRLSQAKFQHYSQEWEEKSDQYQKRTTQLEQQVAEMQEQILQQAQQARELETAVQHWKARGQNSEQNVAQLKAVLEHLVTDRNFADLETALSETSAENWQAVAESARLLNNLKLALSGLLEPTQAPK